MPPYEVKMGGQFFIMLCTKKIQKVFRTVLNFTKKDIFHYQNIAEPSFQRFSCSKLLKILSSNIPDLVNVIGNKTLPIETAYNLHMRDEHTLQQRQIIHILIDCGAVGVFRALISRQYMLAPRYEQTFVGWTIRTMLKIAKSVDSVNQAFQVDIDNIAEQEKLKVYKNEIRLVVKLGAKINATCRKLAIFHFCTTFREFSKIV